MSFSRLSQDPGSPRNSPSLPELLLKLNSFSNRELELEYSPRPFHHPHPAGSAPPFPWLSCRPQPDRQASEAGSEPPGPHPHNGVSHRPSPIPPAHPSPQPCRCRGQGWLGSLGPTGYQAQNRCGINTKGMDDRMNEQLDESRALGWATCAVDKAEHI